MRNKKELLVGMLLTTLVVTGISSSFADSSTDSTSCTDSGSTTCGKMPELTDAQKAKMEEIKTIMEKKKNGETLTSDEETELKEFEANKPQGGEMGGHRGGKEGFMGVNLTDEEKTALKSMTDDEKKAFFEKKKTEAEEKQTAEDNVIDKLLAGETLTADEETVRQEIITERAEMKTKKQEMSEIKTIMEKKKNGETLTSDEETTLEKFEASRPSRDKNSTDSGSTN